MKPLLFALVLVARALCFNQLDYLPIKVGNVWIYNESGYSHQGEKTINYNYNYEIATRQIIKANDTTMVIYDICKKNINSSPNTNIPDSIVLNTKDTIKIFKDNVIKSLTNFHSFVPDQEIGMGEQFIDQIGIINRKKVKVFYRKNDAFRTSNTNSTYAETVGLLESNSVSSGSWFYGSGKHIKLISFNGKPITLKITSSINKSNQKPLVSIKNELVSLNGRKLSTLR